MQNVEMAKKLSTDFKLSVRTSPRIHEEFSVLVLKAGNEGLKFNRRKIGVEAALNALLIEFLDKPTSEQLEILRRNVPRFEAELNGTADPFASPVIHTGQAALDAIDESKPYLDPPKVDMKPKKSGPSRKNA